MAMIPMTSGFSICPEGEQVFRIEKVDYNEEFGKLTVHLKNAKGDTVMNRFSLINQDGTPNDKACNAFSFFAKTALNDFSLTAVDPAQLVGRYIRMEATHSKVASPNDPNKTMTFVNVKNPSVANGFENEQPTPTTGLDLNALLGG